jgi:Ni/Fe-hydrogenase subunit HybB-like protein
MIMTSQKSHNPSFKQQPLLIGSLTLVLVGLGSFLFQLAGDHPERAWQAFLVNFLLFSAVAQGALLFPMVLHITKAKWGEPLKRVAESFVMFFPVSLGLFLLLFPGRAHLFPWLEHGSDGKEAWLNLPFLFLRDLLALVILYGLGAAYVYHARRLRGLRIPMQSKSESAPWVEPDQYRSRMTVISVLYALAYAFGLTLISYDLIMSMQPPWISTLFGPYHFVKAFYLGLGALIIVASFLQVRRGPASPFNASDLHDMGKLFLAFCLLWGDFFYCQLLVIWYGNIPEETFYVIQRTMLMPWKTLAWTVFGLCFVIPFVILLNRKIKTRPVPMMILCSAVFFGLWLEHLLLLGPALNPQATSLPLGLGDGLIALGFLGLMGVGLLFFFSRFPLGLLPAGREEN